MPRKEAKMAYFMVVAKCGHVGKDFFYKGNFFLTEESGKEAALRVRYFPRVKHDHKDAILSVIKLDYMNFLIGKEIENLSPYYKCKSKQEQAEHWDTISRHIYEDPHLENIKLSRRKHQTHSLRKTFNNDPRYETLKNYRGSL